MEDPILPELPETGGLLGPGSSVQLPEPEAPRPQPPQQPGGDGIGIGLKGDFRPAVHIKGLADGVQNGGKPRRAEIAGGTAAEIDGVYPVAGGKGAGFPNMGADGLQVAVCQRLAFLRQGVEVAVAAFAAAEGNMHINAQGNFTGLHKKSHGCLPFVLRCPNCTTNRTGAQG